jgi:hypothetical protein
LALPLLRLWWASQQMVPEDLQNPAVEIRG